MVMCFNPRNSFDPQSCLSYPAEWGRELEGQKGESSWILIKKSLVSEAKACCARHSFSAPHQQAGASPSREAGPQHALWLLGRRDANNPPSSSWPWACHAERDTVGYGIFLWSLEVHCPYCVPSQSFVHLQPVCWGAEGERWGCVGISQQLPKH